MTLHVGPAACTHAETSNPDDPTQAQAPSPGTGISPPPAPPLPPTRNPEQEASIALKTRAAPPGWAFEGKVDKPEWDWLTPPAGLYFFYGTLQDPGILSEILKLDTAPVFRPAYVIGYKIKLWGQYPAMIKEPDAIVEGSVFEVPEEDAAAKLASYETDNYGPSPCRIRMREGGDDENEGILGYTFLYRGNPSDLTDGEFALDRWLYLMGRKKQT